MYIVHEKRFLFFHLRKTGGISIGKMIRNQYPDAEAIHKHKPYLQLPKPYRKYVNDYYVITWVRNPFTRIVSWWEYLKYKSNPKNNKKHNRVEISKFLKIVKTFPELVYSLQKDMSKDRFEHYYFQRTMKSSISNERGTILADYIGKQERFVDDWNSLAPRIGCGDQSIVARNTIAPSGGWNLREYFTSQEMIDIVYNFYKEDFEFFDYDIPPDIQ